MTTYTAIPDTSIDQDSAATEDLLTLLRDNPEAAAEGASGAYKYALKSESAAFSTGVHDFTGLDAWSGVWFTVTAYNTGASNRDIKIDASDDSGSTWLGGELLYTMPGGSAAQITGFLDFATGVVHGVYMSSGAAGRFSQTIVGASTSIDEVRFRGATDITAGVLIHPNGGESTS